MTQLKININKLLYNFSYINSLCWKKSLDFHLVTKFILSDLYIIQRLFENGLEEIGDIYFPHLENIHLKFNKEIKKVLLTTSISSIMNYDL